MHKTIDVLSFGTIYLDIDFLHFPFDEGLFAHRETVGKEYSLEVGGSSFNFAKISASLGACTTFIGKIGQDFLSETLRKMTAESGVDTRFVESPTVQTNLAIHYVHEDGSSIMTSGGSANQDLSVEDLEPLLNELLPQTRYLYLGGSLKLKKLLPFYSQLVNMAKSHGAKIVLDHGRVNNAVTSEEVRIIQSIFPDVDVYLPNKDEFLALWQFSSIEEGLHKLSQTSKTEIIIKDSKNGAHSIANGQVFQSDPPAVTPVNTIGAGDAFNAGYIKALLLETPSFEERIRFASASAGIKISTNELPTEEKVKAYV